MLLAIVKNYKEELELNSSNCWHRVTYKNYKQKVI